MDSKNAERRTRNDEIEIEIEIGIAIGIADNTNSREKEGNVHHRALRGTEEIRKGFYRRTPALARFTTKEAKKRIATKNTRIHKKEEDEEEGKGGVA